VRLNDFTTVRVAVVSSVVFAVPVFGARGQCINSHYVSPPPQMQGGSGCVYSTTPQQLAICQQQEQ
jgi:hypothetical protein